MAAYENKLLQCDIAGSVAHDVTSRTLNIIDGSKPDTRTVSSFHQTNQTSLIHRQPQQIIVDTQTITTSSD